MNLVKQEKVGDCGPACIATVVGCTLAEARTLLPKGKLGITPDEIVEALARCRIPAIESMTWPHYSVQAILSVPSLNHPGLLHYIVWDGTQYLDPTNDPARYPQAAPIVNGEKLLPQWSTVILLWPREAE